MQQSYYLYLIPLHLLLITIWLSVLPSQQNFWAMLIPKAAAKTYVTLQHRTRI